MSFLNNLSNDSCSNILSCLSCKLRSEEWTKLKKDDLALLSQSKTQNHYLAGQTIFYQGNPCLGLFCIASGTVTLRKIDINGHESIVRLLQPGSPMGALSFFAGLKYKVSAVALTDCTICFIDQMTLNDILSRNSEVSTIFLRNVSRLLIDEEEKLHFSHYPVRYRLIHFVLSLKDYYGSINEQGNLIIQLPMSRKDIAIILFARPETLSRLLRQLSDQNIMSFNKQTITIPDLDLLFDEIEPYL